jgi:hypothetical protein
MAAPYKGKWIRISGQVLSSEVVFEDEVCLYLVPYPDAEFGTRLATSVSAYFLKGLDGLDTLHSGDAVTVVGEIQTLNREGLILIGCELSE